MVLMTLFFFLYFQLKSLPMEAVIKAVEKCRDRRPQQPQNNAQSNWISSLWNDKVNTKAGKAMADFVMCAAARKRLGPDQTKKIVAAWLGILKLNYDVNDSDLDLEVEKFVALDDHSMLSYIIGHKLIKEVSTYTSFIIVIVSIESCQVNLFVSRCNGF